jgi:hypothetical protein
MREIEDYEDYEKIELLQNELDKKDVIIDSLIETVKYNRYDFKKELIQKEANKQDTYYKQKYEEQINKYLYTTQQLAQARKDYAELKVLYDNLNKNSEEV